MIKKVLRQKVSPALARLLTAFIALITMAHSGRAQTLTLDPNSLAAIAEQTSSPLIRSSAEDREIKVRVPYDYKSSALGAFELYAKIHGGLDTKLQTVVMINGGPGQSSEGVVPFAQSLRRLGCNVCAGTDLRKSFPAENEAYRLSGNTRAHLE